MYVCFYRWRKDEVIMISPQNAVTKAYMYLNTNLISPVHLQNSLQKIVATAIEKAKDYEGWSVFVNNKIVYTSTWDKQ